MTSYRVWAPGRTTVELLLGDARYPMTPEDRSGFWTAEVDGDASTRDYAFSLDGGQPLPDPRAPQLPGGVHGAARLVDYGSFPWTDGGYRAPPLASAIIYELHVGTFSPDGNFAGAVEKLEHLVDLGITHVELLPVNSFSGQRGWGYDGVGLFAPHQAYGGPEGMQRFVDACHAHDLAVIVDVVYNHLGPDGNYLQQFGPYFTDGYHTPWGQAVNLDGPHSDEVRRFIIDNARMWLRDYHCDGLRIDAVHALCDRSSRHVLEELADEVAALQADVKRSLVLIAETDSNDPRIVRPREAGGMGIDAQWNDELHHAVHAWLTGERAGYYQDYQGGVQTIATCLEQAYVYQGQYSVYRQRRHGRPIGNLSADRFLGYIQTHDQVGNRAQGERISQLVSLERAKIAAAIVLFGPFVPMLFAGEEWAASSPFQYFTDFDESLGALVRDGRRREFSAFGWDPEAIPDPQDRETFERSRLQWAELSAPPHSEMLSWYRRLIALRKSHPSLTDPRLERTRARPIGATGLSVERGSLTLLAHVGEGALDMPGRGAVLLASSDAVSAGEGIVSLPGEGVAILLAEG